MITTDADLIRSAVTTGLITDREIASGSVAVEGSRLRLYGRTIAYARHAPGWAGAAHREAACLRALAGSGLVPESVSGSGDVGWLLALPGARLSEVHGTMAELADICQAWGSAVAALHRCGIPAGAEAPAAPRPWVLDPERLPRSMRRLPAASARAFVLRTLTGDRGLRCTIDRVADHWTADHWIHGELSADRVLVQQTPEVRVRFVNLDAGGLGDPAWDLAGAVETIAELTGGSRAPWRGVSEVCLRDYLLQGYRRAGGPAVVTAGTRALRIVARAWQAAAGLDQRAGHPATMHPAAGHADEAARLTRRLVLARELAERSARPGLVAA
ncbi:MAG: phosphotransferase [Microlunatus sp.]